MKLLVTVILFISIIPVFGQNTFYRSVDISPGGQKMVFESNKDGGYPELYLANIDGTNVIRLTNNTFIEGSAKWSPDGKSIVFYVLEDISTVNFDIHILDIETKFQRKITLHKGLDFAPVWSSDGKRIYYTSKREEIDELRVFDIKAQTHELVLKNIEHHYGISLSPDGSMFAAIRVFEKDWDVVIIDVKTKKEIKRFKRSSKENNIIWSPDGETLFFASNMERTWNIYSMDIYGQNLKSLTLDIKDDARFFTVSPDGKYIYYTMVRKGTNDLLYKMKSDGSNKKEVTFN